uniref:Ig-like domain-containing protein n=1 Tax=Callorhinchus milii TaxID=7868 RepID=A0A4W3GPJ3_CALMI
SCFSQGVLPPPSNLPQPDPQLGNVTLSKTSSCTYSADFTDVLMYWYLQYPGDPPLYTRRHDYDGDTFSAEFAKQRFSTTLDTNTKRYGLTVFPVALSDMAKYYCAIRLTVLLSDYTAVHKPPKRRERDTSQNRCYS